MLDLMRRASETVRAEHAIVNGVHAKNGCHACHLFGEFRKYVLATEGSYPSGEPLVSAILDGHTKFAIWIGGDLTHKKWEVLCQYVALFEPEAVTAPAAQPPPEAQEQVAEPGEAKKEEGT